MADPSGGQSTTAAAKTAQAGVRRTGAEVGGAAGRLRVVIVAWRSAADLRRCLPTLRGEEACEVVVVDNAADEETRRLIEEEHPWAAWWAPGYNLGFARANNLGSEGFGGEYLCFLNPDTEVAPGALGRLVAFLDGAPQAAAAGPFVANPDGSRQLSCRRWPGISTALFHRYSLLTRLWPANPWSRRYLMSDEAARGPRPVDWLSACCLMVRRTDFRDVGGFDARYFMFCEDTDLCRRFAARGRERWYVPAARVVHHVGKSAAERSVRLVYERHRSMWIYFRTWNRWWPLLAPLVGAGLAGRFLLYALRAGLSRPG
jgi:GT2 family glycosyltransferase